MGVPCIDKPLPPLVQDDELETTEGMSMNDSLADQVSRVLAVVPVSTWSWWGHAGPRAGGSGGRCRVAHLRCCGAWRTGSTTELLVFLLHCQLG